MTSRLTYRREEPINTILKKHVEETKDWEHHDLAGIVHEWVHQINSSFFDGTLPRLALKFEPLRKGRFGQFCHGRGSSGILYELTLNTKILHRPIPFLLMGLLIELTHLWEEMSGLSPSKHTYLTVAFRKKIREFGLVCTDRGQQKGILPDSPFLRFLTVHDLGTDMVLTVDDPNQDLPLFRIDHSDDPDDPESGTSKLIKWSCGCKNIRASVELNIVCLDCESPFHKSPPAW